MANICLHKSIDTKTYPLREAYKGLLEKIREDVVSGPSIVFTRKAVVDENFIRMSTEHSKSFVGLILANYTAARLCQPTPTGLYTR